MILITLWEGELFLFFQIKEKLLMDTTRSELLDIYLDVTFHHLPCDRKFMHHNNLGSQAFLAYNSVHINHENHLTHHII